MATSTAERPPSQAAQESVEEAIRHHTMEEQEDRLKVLAYTAVTGALKLIGLSLIAAVAGYSAGVGSENCREYYRKQRERNTVDNAGR
ncbi:hypothetical protein D3C87_279790 [compost metagenome]